MTVEFPETSEEKVWVDFKQLKESVTIEMVLAHYGVPVKKRGKELRAKCPLHEGADKQKGWTFAASPEKKKFQCFICKASGDVLDLVKAKEGGTLRDAGLKIQAWFGIQTQQQRAVQPVSKKTAPRSPARVEPPPAQSGMDEDELPY